MRDITIIMPYYINEGMLKKHYEHFAAMPKDLLEHLRLTIVDDGSPYNEAKPPPGGGWYPGLSIYRITVDVRWNQDAARNIGVHHAETEWILLTDIDHMIPLETLYKVVNAKLDPSCAYRFRRVTAPEMTKYKPHPNSWLLTKDTYWKMGGYDESLAGYYGTDADFARRLAAVARIQMLKEPLIRVPRTYIPDASTTTYERKAPEDRENLPRLFAERRDNPNWKPKVLSFPYMRVF